MKNWTTLNFGRSLMDHILQFYNLMKYRFLDLPRSDLPRSTKSNCIAIWVFNKHTGSFQGSQGSCGFCTSSLKHSSSFVFIDPHVKNAALCIDAWSMQIIVLGKESLHKLVSVSTFQETKKGKEKMKAFYCNYFCLVWLLWLCLCITHKAAIVVTWTGSFRPMISWFVKALQTTANFRIHSNDT